MKKEIFKLIEKNCLNIEESAKNGIIAHHVEVDDLIEDVVKLFTTPILDKQTVCPDCGDYGKIQDDKPACDTCKHSGTAVCFHCKRFDDTKNTILWAENFEFKVGKWYTNDLEIFYLTKISKNGKYWGYGFKHLKIWNNNTIWAVRYDENWKLADMEEVNKLLLEKANKDYSEGTEIINSFNIKVCINEDPFRFGKLPNTTKDIYSNDGSHCIYEEGKWAEILEESKLMLGDIETELLIKNNIIKVWTKVGSVTIEEWLNWFEIVDKFYTRALSGNIGLKLGEYYAESFMKNAYTEIGCIKKITYNQLKAITKAIKESNFEKLENMPHIIDIGKDCNTCKYKENSISESPCNDCKYALTNPRTKNNWQSKESK